MRLHFAKKYSLREANKMRGEEYFVTLLDSVRDSGQNFSVTFQIVFATLHQAMQSVEVLSAIYRTELEVT